MRGRVNRVQTIVNARVVAPIDIRGGPKGDEGRVGSSEVSSRASTSSIGGGMSSPSTRARRIGTPTSVRIGISRRRGVCEGTLAET